MAVPCYFFEGVSCFFNFLFGVLAVYFACLELICVKPFNLSVVIMQY